MALITTQRLYAVVSHASQHRQQQQRNAQIAPQSAAVGDAVQIDMLGAVGVGKQIGDDPFGVERGMHEHTGQPPQLAPLLMCRIIIQAHRRPRLIDQHAAFIAGDQETAGRRAV